MTVVKENLKKSRSGKVSAKGELRKWREWAQFVFLGGGLVSGTDDELRRRVCEAVDIEADKAKKGA